MHRALAGLPNRVVLDTQILLNGFFIEDSYAREALNYLALLKYKVYISEYILNECLKIIYGNVLRYNLNFKIVDYFNKEIQSLNFILIQDSDITPNLSLCNKKDKPISDLASHISGWILSSDADFIDELNKSNIENRMPWDIIQEYKLKFKNGYEDINNSIRIRRLSPYKGSLYIKFEPMAWADGPYEGLYYLFEIENLYKIYYNNKNKEFIFETNNISVKLKTLLSSNTVYMFCLSYDYYSKDSNINLYLGDYNGKCVRSNPKKAKFKFNYSNNKMSVCSSIKGTNQMCGWLRNITGSSSIISYQLFKKCLKIEESVIYVFDNDRLKDSMSEMSKRIDFTFVNNPQVYL
jgi:predicted nucleic acid-binding protein